jgi:molecular chaperone GrpE
MDKEELKQESEPIEINSEECAESSELEQLKCRLDKALKERDEYLEYAKRMKADFENYRRRNSADSLEQYDNGRARIIEDTLSILDNIERAVDAAQDEATKQGVALVLKQLQDLYTKWGVVPIDRTGEVFDPMLEHAVMQGEGAAGDSGKVLQVLQKGYKLGNRILRFAMVKVAQ